LDILKRWNPDNTDNIPNQFMEKLQVFNYSDYEQRELAEAYRNAEVPFKVYGIENLDEVTKRWTDQYLLQQMESPHISYKVFRSFCVVIIIFFFFFFFFIFLTAIVVPIK
jgi:predicted RNA-binding protein with EMAP domain